MAMNIDEIAPLALGIGVAIVTVAILMLVLVAMIPSTYIDVLTNNYTFTGNTTTLPGSINSITWLNVFNNTQQNYPALVRYADYMYWNENNTLQINGTAPLNAPIKSVNFQFKAITNATYVVNKGVISLQVFSDWFNILIIVVIAVVILGLLLLLRGRGGES